MKIKPSGVPGHVLLDLDEAGIRLLAKVPLLASETDRSDPGTLWQDLHARVTWPLKLESDEGSWRNFGIND